MNTFRDYYQALTTSEREAFDLAYNTSGRRPNFDWDREANTFSDFIDGSFIWANTPQGQEYWEQLNLQKRYTAKDSRQVRLYVEHESEGHRTTIAYKDAKAIFHPFYDIDGEPRYINQQTLERTDYFCPHVSDRDGKTTIALRRDRYQVIRLESGHFGSRTTRDFVCKWDANYAEESTLIPVPANSIQDREYRDRATDRLYFKDAETALICGFYVADNTEVIPFRDLQSRGMQAVKIYHPEYSGKVVVVRESELNGEQKYTLLSSKCKAAVSGMCWVNYAVFTSDFERFKEEGILVEDYQGEWVIHHDTEVIDCGSSGMNRFYIPHIENEGRVTINGILHSVSLVYHEGDVYLNDEIANDNGVYWCSDCEEYYHEDYEDDHSHSNDDIDEDYSYNPRYGYHSQEHYDRARGAKFKVGFEIEKECGEGCKHNHHEIREASGWVKERDGSLDDYKGYELVSSTYNLFTDEFMNQAKDLEKKFPNLINGNASRNCGGHIHFSKADTLGADLLESICGYLPVLYSIYQHRIGKSYCEVKEKEQMKHSDNKYQAVRVMRSRIEFRIFPAVKNLSTLEWRLGLIRIMAKNPSSNPIEVANRLSDSRTELHKHFAKIFSKSAIMQKAQKALTFAKQFDKNYYNIDLRINLDKIKAKENRAIRQESGKKKRQAVTA